MTKKNLTIFLDIDGVIATEYALDKAWQQYLGEKWYPEWHKKHTNLSHPGLGMDDWPFDTSCTYNIHILQRSFKNTKVVYVISSSWRTGRTIQELYDLFKLKGLNLNEIIGKTTSERMNRGQQILQYIKEHKIGPFLVIDDEINFDIKQHIEDKFTINTSFKTGFDSHALNQAINKAEKQLYP